MNPCWERKAKYHTFVPYKNCRPFTDVNYNLFSATRYTNLKHLNEDVIWAFISLSLYYRQHGGATASSHFVHFPTSSHPLPGLSLITLSMYKCEKNQWIPSCKTKLPCKLPFLCDVVRAFGTELSLALSRTQRSTLECLITYRSAAPFAGSCSFLNTCSLK